MAAMAMSRLPSAALEQAMRLLGPGDATEMAIRQAAWVARCVGRGESSPLDTDDLTALATFLRTRHLARGELLFQCGSAPPGVWIVQHGRLELSVGAGHRRPVVHVLQPGDVDGDIQHFLDMPVPYTAHALDEATLLFLGATDSEQLPASAVDSRDAALATPPQRKQDEHAHHGQPAEAEPPGVAAVEIGRPPERGTRPDNAEQSRHSGPDAAQEAGRSPGEADPPHRQPLVTRSARPGSGFTARAHRPPPSRLRSLARSPVGGPSATPSIRTSEPKATWFLIRRASGVGLG